MKIAVSGKGGVGKTTVSASLAQLFAERGYQVFAVDADPDASLGITLGLPDELLEKLKPIIDMRELIAEKSGGGGAFYSLNPRVDDVLEQYSIQQGNIKFLRMGGIKQGGTACYCRENSFLHALVDSLLLDSKDAVILDMGAGIEHLTRGTAKGVDLMLVVTEPTKVSVQTAKIVQRLAGELGVEKVKVIANKIRNEKERDFIKASFHPDEIIGMVGYNTEVLDLALSGGDNSRKTLLSGLETIFQDIIREAGEAKGMA